MYFSISNLNVEFRKQIRQEELQAIARLLPFPVKCFVYLVLASSALA